MQDVLDRVREAERRAAQVHEDYNSLRTDVAVLQTRYTDLKQTLEGVVERQGAQAERLGGIDGSIKELHVALKNIDKQIAEFKNLVGVRVGGGAAAGGTLAAAVYLLVEFVLKGGA